MEVDLCLEQAQALPVPKNSLNLKTLCSKFLKHNHMEFCVSSSSSNSSGFAPDYVTRRKSVCSGSLEEQVALTRSDNGMLRESARPVAAPDIAS